MRERLHVADPWHPPTLFERLHFTLSKSCLHRSSLPVHSHTFLLNWPSVCQVVTFNPRRSASWQEMFDWGLLLKHRPQVPASPWFLRRWSDRAEDHFTCLNICISSWVESVWMMFEESHCFVSGFNEWKFPDSRLPAAGRFAFDHRVCTVAQLTYVCLSHPAFQQWGCRSSCTSNKTNPAHFSSAWVSVFCLLFVVFIPHGLNRVLSAVVQWNIHT